MSSLDHEPLSREQRKVLLTLARASIRHGLETGRPLPVRTQDYPERLREIRASFVTLNEEGRLRGCIGHLEAIQPLAVDVAENAFAAAFRDPRFPPLREHEYPHLEVHISILTPPEPLRFDSEEDLLRQIRPGRDGLILEDGLNRGTFLPSVWSSLPRVQEFWTQLKHKAGLPGDYWSDTLKVFRYETEEFSDQDV